MGYFLPGNLGGFYGQAQYYLGENLRNGAATEKDGTGGGLRLGYANGPFNVALALSETDYAAGNVKQNNIGGQWDFGVAKAMAQYEWDKNGTTKAKGWLIGGLFPVGAGEIRASYSMYRVDLGAKPETGKFALGYVHNLSKRTAVYTTFRVAEEQERRNSSSERCCLRRRRDEREVVRLGPGHSPQLLISTLASASLDRRNLKSRLRAAFFWCAQHGRDMPLWPTGCLLASCRPGSAKETPVLARQVLC